MTKQTGKKWMTYGLSLVLLLVCIAMVLAADRSTNLPVTKLPGVSAPATTERGMRPLRVMSFNVAHGSKNMFGVVPLFRRAKTIKQRLRIIAAFINSQNPDVVGFQEADGPSWWSGRFHHVNYIAQHGGFPFAILGEHVKTKRKRYGAALISRRQMLNAISHRFKPLTYFKKGMVIATVRWPGAPKIEVDVVSLHLDPSKAWVQKSQLQEVVQVVKQRKRPVIVLGDFNTTWFGKDSPLKVLTQELQLKTYKPYNPYMFTHHFPKKRRIDWIFISKELRFASHKIIQKKLTDHYPLLAEIEYRLPTKAKPAPARVAPARVAPARVAPVRRTVVPARPAARPAATRPAATRPAARVAPIRVAPIRLAPVSQPASRPASQPASRPAAR